MKRSHNEHRVDCSIVIPVYNEETNIRLLIPELQGVLDKLGKTYEMIFVNDGSSDHTGKIIAEAARRSPPDQIDYSAPEFWTDSSHVCRI